MNARKLIQCDWDEVPHLSPEAKAEYLASVPPYQRDARSKGTPQLGAGAIYPVPESDVIVEDFPIPEHWPRVYGMDVGWNVTAAVFAAHDREAKRLYLYSEHYRGEAEPVVHAQAIKSRGDWIPGVIDPASRGRGQKDGEQLLQNYLDLGLKLELADNGVEAGLLLVWTLLSAGALKVFKSLQNWRDEFRLYRRDEKGQVVKKKDHIMDATRYLCVSGREHAKVRPVPRDPETRYVLSDRYAGGWMG